MADELPDLFALDADTPGLTEERLSFEVTEDNYDRPLPEPVPATARFRMIDTSDFMEAYVNGRYSEDAE